jgi:hypothetical protein
MLIASPDAYAWLRRKAGLDEGATPSDAAYDDEGESTFDTREARLSLRARLSEAEADTQVTPPPAAAKPKVAPPATPPATTDERPLAARPRPRREEVEPMRRAVDDARERMLATARKATQENGPAA